MSLPPPAGVPPPFRGCVPGRTPPRTRCRADRRVVLLDWRSREGPAAASGSGGPKRDSAPNSAGGPGRTPLCCCATPTARTLVPARATAPPRQSEPAPARSADTASRWGSPGIPRGRPVRRREQLQQHRPRNARIVMPERLSEQHLQRRAAQRRSPRCALIPRNGGQAELPVPLVLLRVAPSLVHGQRNDAAPLFGTVTRRQRPARRSPTAVPRRARSSTSTRRPRVGSPGSRRPLAGPPRFERGGEFLHLALSRQAPAPLDEAAARDDPGGMKTSPARRAARSSIVQPSKRVGR